MASGKPPDGCFWGIFTLMQPHFPAVGEDLWKHQQSAVLFGLGDKRMCVCLHPRVFYLSPVFDHHPVQAVISTLAACLQGSW